MGWGHRNRVVGSEESRVPCWVLLLEMLVGNPCGDNEWGDIQGRSQKGA